MCTDFSQGMTNIVRFTFNVSDTTWAVYNYPTRSGCIEKYRK